MLASMDWTQLQPVIILLVVAIIARFNPIPNQYHPSQLLGFCFTTIANKVNNPDRSHKQQTIAGALSIAFMLALLSTACAILQFVVIEDLIFELLVLVAFLQWEKLQLTEVNLGELEKTTFTEQLKFKTLRQLESLSILGLHKTSIETLCLRNAYQWFAVVFWYLVAGIWAVIVYRLVQLMAQYWNCKRKDFSYFGLAAAKLLNLLSVPSHYLLAMTLSLFHQPVTSLSQAKKQSSLWHHAASGFLLASFAHSLSIQLGGPRKYSTEITRFAQLGNSNSVNKIDILRAQQRLNMAALLWLISISIIMVGVSLW